MLSIYALDVHMSVCLCLSLSLSLSLLLSVSASASASVSVALKQAERQAGSQKLPRLNMSTSSIISLVSVREKQMSSFDTGLD